MENENKEVKVKSLFERHITEDKKFNWQSFVAEVEAMIETDRMKIRNLEEAMQFFIEWYEKEEAKKPKLILPDNDIVRPI